MDFNPNPETTTLKFIVLGESTVGKTALIHSFVHGNFQNSVNVNFFKILNHNNLKTKTIGISVEVKRFLYKDRHFELDIWDTAGQERYRAIISRHYKEKHGIILTIDLSNPNFESIDYWMEQIANNATKDMPMILVGTKLDLNKEINLDAFKAFADSKELPFIATSAKNNENVDLAFESLLNEVLYRDFHILLDKKQKDEYFCKTERKKKTCC